MRISDWSSDVCSSDLLALDITAQPAHCFETPHMGFGIAFRRGRIVAQMGVDRVTPLIGGGDLGDRAVGLAYPGLDRRDTDDGAVGVGLDILALAEFDIMRAPIGRLDDQIVARSEEHTSEHQAPMRN